MQSPSIQIPNLQGMTRYLNGFRFIARKIDLAKYSSNLVTSSPSSSLPLPQILDRQDTFTWPFRIVLQDKYGATGSRSLLKFRSMTGCHGTSLMQEGCVDSTASAPSHIDYPACEGDELIGVRSTANCIREDKQIELVGAPYQIGTNRLRERHDYQNGISAGSL